MVNLIEIIINTKAQVKTWAFEYFIIQIIVSDYFFCFFNAVVLAISD
jgi:hypothetical protein